jgi:hypothetical protein
MATTYFVPRSSCGRCGAPHSAAPQRPQMTRRRIGLRFAYDLRRLQGPSAPSPLRSHAHADAFRGLPAFAFALPGRQRMNLASCRISRNGQLTRVRNPARGRNQIGFVPPPTPGTRNRPKAQPRCNPGPGAALRHSWLLRWLEKCRKLPGSATIPPSGHLQSASEADIKRLRYRQKET